MGKNMAKMTAFLLVLAMALSMTACGGGDRLIGTWEAEIDFAPVFNESLGEGEDAAYLKVDSLKFRMVLTLTEAGRYTMTADEASVDAAMEQLKEELKAGVERYLVDTVGSTGLKLSIEEINARMEITMDALIDQVLTPELIDQMTQTMVSEGRYMAEDGKLYMSDGVDTQIDEAVYDVYILEGDKLTLVTTSQTDEYTDLMYPLEFSRVTE